MFKSRHQLHVGASVVSLAPTYFYKSERTHSAAPPFQIEPAALGFDLVLDDASGSCQIDPALSGFDLVFSFPGHSACRGRISVI